MKYYMKFIGMLFLIFIFIEMQGCSETDILYRENISEDSDIRQIQKENEKNKGTAIMSSDIKNYNNNEVMTPSSDAEGYIMQEDFGIFDLMHDTVSYNGITYYKWRKTFTKRNIEEQLGYSADGATDFALIFRKKRKNVS